MEPPGPWGRSSGRRRAVGILPAIPGWKTRLSGFHSAIARPFFPRVGAGRPARLLTSRCVQGQAARREGAWTAGALRGVGVGL